MSEKERKKEKTGREKLWMRDNSLFLESDMEYSIIFSFSVSLLTELSPFLLYLSHTVWSFSFRALLGSAVFFSRRFSLERKSWLKKSPLLSTTWCAGVSNKAIVLWEWDFAQSNHFWLDHSLERFVPCIIIGISIIL